MSTLQPRTVLRRERAESDDGTRRDELRREVRRRGGPPAEHVAWAHDVAGPCCQSYVQEAAELRTVLVPPLSYVR